MALAMSRPFATKQGSYYLNVKVPLALRPLAKGQRVSLPLDGEHHSVVVGEKVVFSLRTKEAKIARERFPPALEALNAFFACAGGGDAHSAYFLICDCYGRLDELDQDLAALTDHAARGYEVESARLEISGRCPDCR